MKYRQIRKTNLKVSEVGFGLWTISTGWWGKFTDDEAVALMHKAFDLGVTLYDAADTYGNGRSEELLAKAFPTRRDEIVIATKIGYDFYNHAGERKGQREIPQDFSPKFIRFAVDQALLRLKTDRIDILQLHNIHSDQVADDAIWATLEELQKEGKSSTQARRSDRRLGGCTRAWIVCNAATQPFSNTFTTCWNSTQERLSPPPPMGS